MSSLLRFKNNSRPKSVFQQGNAQISVTSNKVTFESTFIYKYPSISMFETFGKNIKVKPVPPPCTVYVTKQSTEKVGLYSYLIGDGLSALSNLGVKTGLTL